MPIRGPISHIDLCCSDPDRSLPFYGAFFEALGYQRGEHDGPGFGGERPTRAAWYFRDPSGYSSGFEVRRARRSGRHRPHDRWTPGLHHMAFHAESQEAVDGVYRVMRDAGATILDPPREYGGPAYGGGYYAAFFSDPDGVKLEVVHHPPSNP
ncbi:MAG: VOC family protein [Myxococcota bacterium]|nr:VOC family protein [Myxococcota bacterium]